MNKKQFVLRVMEGRFTAKSAAETWGNEKARFEFVFVISDLVREGKVKCLGFNPFSENVYKVVR